jgi:hypothetical protein
MRFQTLQEMLWDEWGSGLASCLRRQNRAAKGKGINKKAGPRWLCLFFQMKSGLHDFPNLLTPAGRARPGPMSGTSWAGNGETSISRPTDQYTGTME